MAALTDWNFGLRVGTRSAMPVFHSDEWMVDPLSPATVVETSTTSSPPTATQSAGYHFMELHLPVDYNTSNRDFANETSSDEGERLVTADSPPPQQPEASGTPTATTSAGTSGMQTLATTAYAPEGTTASAPTVTYHITPIVQLRAQQSSPSATQM